MGIGFVRVRDESEDFFMGKKRRRRICEDRINVVQGEGQNVLIAKKIIVKPGPFARGFLSQIDLYPDWVSWVWPSVPWLEYSIVCICRP